MPFSVLHMIELVPFSVVDQMVYVISPPMGGGRMTVREVQVCQDVQSHVVHQALVTQVLPIQKMASTVSPSYSPTVFSHTVIFRLPSTS